jgi:quercetin dioxygenase-like cupin family protein
MRARSRRAAAVWALCAIAGAASCARQETVAPAHAGDQAMHVTAAADRGSFAGDAAHFTGEATIGMLFAPNGPRDFSSAYVTFQPGARTAWHTHPAGQTLVVTEGSGWVQVEGDARRDMKSGDVVWIPPDTRHWHGGTVSSAVTHIALQGEVGGSVVSWAEHVSDAQYLGSAQ